MKKEKLSKFSTTEDCLKYKLEQKYPEIKIREVPYIIKKERPRRNKPCPCNSGLKFKKCCLFKEIQKRIDKKLIQQDKIKEEIERKKKGIVSLG